MPSTDSLRVLSLQPFYGGSHKQFIDGWIEHSSFSWQQLTLPAHHWKWRMRHAAVHFAREVDRLVSDGAEWDLILCTDMLNLAEFRGLLRNSVGRTPVLAYFHENQFEYPDQANRERDFHFAFTNFTTALSADLLWFNSHFNLESMLSHLQLLSRKWPDYAPVEPLKEIEAKAIVQPPGVYHQPRTQHTGKESGHVDVPHIVWAGRWEHDKNPVLLLRIIEQLEIQGTPFQVSIIGQQFPESPPEFAIIRERYADRIRWWGFQSSRQHYFEVLASSDIFLSTAAHEFFGLSTVESVCCGCLPILPDRLVYPELLQIAQNPSRRCFPLPDGFASRPFHRQTIVKTTLQCLVTSYKWNLFSDIPGQ